MNEADPDIRKLGDGVPPAWIVDSLIKAGKIRCDALDRGWKFVDVIDTKKKRPPTMIVHLCDCPKDGEVQVTMEGSEIRMGSGPTTLTIWAGDCRECGIIYWARR
jgi:hypothetical protein